MFFILSLWNGGRLVFVFWVSSIFGVSINGLLGLVEIGINGWLLSIVVIFVINVIRILWVSWCLGCFRRMVFKICLVSLIIFFYILFIWEEYGVLNI